MIHVGDITKLNGATLPVVDVITGGSPCQDLSIAGKRQGLAGERSGLFMEQIRIVKEMREHDRQCNGRTGFLCRPRYMVWENVPGAFSSNKGADFAAVLTEIVRICEPNAPDVLVPKGGKWTKSGLLYDDMGRWSIAWRAHDAQFWGVPQRRKRIAVVADFGGLSAPEILFERKGLRGDLEASNGEGEDAPQGVIPSPSQAISFQERAGKAGGGKGILIQDEHVGALSTVNNQSVLQTPFGISSYESNAMRSSNPNSGIYRVKTARTLDNTGGNPSCNQGGIAVVQTYRKTSHPQTKDGYQGWEETKVADSLNVFDNSEARTPVLIAPHAMETAVRRLTPLECERLQGYPDGWTDIGEWVDTKGKVHKESSDAARYKALGNSIALPFWFWLLRRISAQYERPATLGSLFDGIGGFPLCWERCNGRGTAIWASEIEEFPIAVTKYHFREGDNHE